MTPAYKDINMGSDTLPVITWRLRDTDDDHNSRKKLLYRLGIFHISRVSTIRKLTHIKRKELNGY